MTVPVERAVATTRCNFVVREAGPVDGPLVVLIHGFPDTPHTFDTLSEGLAARGIHVVAPYLPGYAPTSPPTDGARESYEQRVVVAALAELIDALGGRAHLVGHDWGAVATYLLGGLYPERVGRAVAAAVPAPLALLRGMSVRQARRSAYMAFFQLRGVAERRAAANEFAYVRALWRAWSPGWAFTDADFAPVATCFRVPGSLTNALGYYRSIGPALLLDGAGRRAAFGRLGVPTLVVAGADDGCMGVEVMKRSVEAGATRVEVLANAGHFMHRERPEAFEALVVDHLGL